MQNAQFGDKYTMKFGTICIDLIQAASPELQKINMLKRRNSDE